MENQNNQTSEELKISISELQKCQKEKQQKSCFSCPESTSESKCEIHQKYIDLVYKSMSNGNSGNFDF